MTDHQSRMRGIVCVRGSTLRIWSYGTSSGARTHAITTPIYTTMDPVGSTQMGHQSREGTAQPPNM